MTSQAAGAPGGSSLGFLSSLQFQFMVAILVLLASFVPTLIANYRSGDRVSVIIIEPMSVTS